MKLPGGENAVVDLEKLTEYILSEHHPRGRHKARLFRSLLAMPKGDAEGLRGWLLKAASTGDAVPGVTDEYGARYIIDLEVPRQDRQVTIRSAWMLSAKETVPRFITCFIL